MKVLILAGGMGSRLSEETVLKPKPMVEIGGKPIIWHIMKIYSSYDYNEFVVLCGYKGYMIKEYFINYFDHMSDITVDMTENRIIHHRNKAEPWKVTLIDTGIETMTGGRIKRAAPYIQGERFMLTYGDGVGNIDIRRLVRFHEKHGKAATMTAVLPEGRFGAVEAGENDIVSNFREKPVDGGSWINGGFFVCEPEVINYISDDTTIFEREPLENLARANQLYAYKHKGFWKPMDTLRDKMQLAELLDRNEAPWVRW